MYMTCVSVGQCINTGCRPFTYLDLDLHFSMGNISRHWKSNAFECKMLPCSYRSHFMFVVSKEVLQKCIVLICKKRKQILPVDS